MIVKRPELTWAERLYLPAIWGGIKVTLRHFLRKPVTMQYPEERWVVPEGYRGAPYLVRDQEGHTKCVSCQLCEFVCPPKAIRITPPGPDGRTADRANAEKMPEEFEINMLRCIFCGLCEEACPTNPRSIWLATKTYELGVYERNEALYLDKSKLTKWDANVKPYPGVDPDKAPVNPAKEK